MGLEPALSQQVQTAGELLRGLWLRCSVYDFAYVHYLGVLQCAFVS